MYPIHTPRPLVHPIHTSYQHPVAPKRNHAEQRRELERDHREVSKALELLESLQLMGQPRSDHH